MLMVCLCRAARGWLWGCLCVHGKTKGKEKKETLSSFRKLHWKGTSVNKTKPGFTQLLKSCLKFQNQDMMLFVETESHYPACPVASVPAAPQMNGNRHWWDLDSTTDINIRARPAASYKSPALGHSFFLSFFLPDANHISIRLGRPTVI